MITKRVQEISTNYHARAGADILAELKTSREGLSVGEAQRRLAQYGPNEIPDKGGANPLIIFLKQFNSALVYILILAAVISFFAGHAIDAYVIAFIIVANAVIGFVQEYKAERAVRELKKAVVLKAQVYRDEELIEIDSSGLVPGDVVLIEAGQKIPADVRLLEVREFQTVEAALTGESVPVFKTTDNMVPDTALIDRKNMAWMGTFATAGEALGVVVATGARTVIGGIATSLGEIKDPNTHFQVKIKVLATQMAIVAIVGASVIFVIGFFFKELGFIQIFLFAIAALVSGIPEGLPAILTIVLAAGAYRMAKRNALIKYLPATETLGVASTIITDKTGTLTQNSMLVEKVVLASGTEAAVQGNGWEPKGDFLVGGENFLPLEHMDMAKMLHIASLCNKSHLTKEGDAFVVSGDPTEAALLVLAKKAGVDREHLSGIEKVVYDVPFSSEKKFRASLVEVVGKSGEVERWIYAVGAPEELIARCATYSHDGERKNLTDHKLADFHHQIDLMTDQALRTLALAFCKAPAGGEITHEDFADGVLVGVVGMRDPIRPDVPEAIAKARNAGIKVIMATGDHRGTAFAIAREVGLIDGDKPDGLVYTQNDLEKMSEAEFSAAVERALVFARLTPNMKLRIAEALQAKGQVIAMTGDGVNDAPALKKADIGIAMGIAGTDVARESADMVLADDNFASIVNAIEEGRTVFINTRQASTFLITTNFAENVTIICTMLMGLPLPLITTQILWLNLVTDGVSGTPLAFEPVHKGVLDEGVRDRSENILNKTMAPFLVLIVGLMTLGTVAVFSLLLDEGIEKARTGAFAVMAFTQVFNVFNMRSLKHSVFEIGFFGNKYLLWGVLASFVLTLTVLYLPWLQHVFTFVSLDISELLLIIGFSSLVLWFGEIYKLAVKMASAR